MGNLGFSPICRQAHIKRKICNLKDLTQTFCNSTVHVFIDHIQGAGTVQEEHDIVERA